MDINRGYKVDVTFILSQQNNETQSSTLENVLEHTFVFLNFCQRRWQVNSGIPFFRNCFLSLK